MSDFVRTFSKFFADTLTPSQRDEIDRALSEVQNLKEITSLETSVKLLTRKVNQGLPIPQVFVQTAVRGGSITWTALPDQRINFYEVEVSDNIIFSNFETFPTFGTRIEIDGITQTKFVRVRGVRTDGTTTPYSDTAILAPNLFEIRDHIDEGFYIAITGTDPVIVAGGEDTDMEYQPTNNVSQSKVWGFITTYADPAVGLLGLDQIYADVVVKKIDEFGSLISEKIEWRVTMGEFFNSHSIGPFTVTHPGLNETLQIRLEVTDKTTLADGTSRSGDRTFVEWAYLAALEIGI